MMIATSRHNIFDLISWFIVLDDIIVRKIWDIKWKLLIAAASFWSTCKPEAEVIMSNELNNCYYAMWFEIFCTFWKGTGEKGKGF